MTGTFDPSTAVLDEFDPSTAVLVDDEQDAKKRRKDVPKMSVGSVAQDLVSGALQIGPTAVKGVADITRLATGDRLGKDTSEAMKRGITSIQDVIGSDRAAAQRQNFEADMADESVNAWETIKNNKGALADMALPTVGSMFLPVGVAGAAGKVATIGKAAQSMQKAALTDRVAKVQKVAGIGTIAAQNAAETFVDLIENGTPMEDAYIAAGITVPFSVVAGVLTGGGAEGAITRAMTRTGAVKTGVAQTLKASGREGAQEMGEELGQITGKAVATGEAPTPNSALKQLSVAGTLGAVIGGGVDVASQLDGFGKPITSAQSDGANPHQNQGGAEPTVTPPATAPTQSTIVQDFAPVQPANQEDRIAEILGEDAALSERQMSLDSSPDSEIERLDILLRRDELAQEYADLNPGQPVNSIPSDRIAQSRDQAATQAERQAIEQEMQRRGITGETDGATDQGGQVSTVAAQGVEGASADVPGSGSDSKAGVSGGVAGGSGSAGIPGGADGSPVPAGPTSAPGVNPEFDVSGRTDEQLANLVKGGKPGWREAAIEEVARRNPVTTPVTPLQESAPAPVTQQPASLPVESAARTLDEEGRATDGKPINPGDVFRTLSGRNATPYPKQKGQKYASQWLIDNATAEAESRGDDFNARTFKNSKPLKDGTLTTADREGMLMYLFSQQSDVVPSILKPLTGEPLAPKPEPLAQTQGQAQGAEGKTEGVEKSTLEDLGLYREYAGRHQYRIASRDGTVSGGWYTSNSMDGAIEIATKQHNIMPPESRLTRAQRDAKADAEYDAESDRRYGKLTTDQLRAEVDRLTADISSLQKAGKREFNGNGGRRTGAAVSNEGARMAGEEKMRLERMIKQREATEVSTFDQRFPNIKAAEKVIKDRSLKQVAVFKDGDKYRIGARTGRTTKESNNLIQRIKQLGGIHTRYRADLIGDKAGAPGLFSNTGKGLDDLATTLKADGFNIDTDTVDGGVEAMTNLIQRASIQGETILSMAGQERAAQKSQETDYRDKLKEEIDQAGGTYRKNATTKQLEATVEELRAKEAMMEREAIQSHVELADDLSYEIVSTAATEDEFMAAMGFTKKESNEINGITEKTAEGIADRSAQEGDGAGTGQGQDQAFELTAETSEEVKAREEAQAAKDKAESDRAKADEQPFIMTGSNRPADELAARGQQDIFSQKNSLNAPKPAQKAPDSAERTEAKPADKPEDDRDHFVLERLNRDTNKMEKVTFERGEYITYKNSDKGESLYGDIDGISHARREFSVDGLWHPFGYAYKAERPSPVEKPTVPLSNVLAARMVVIDKPEGEAPKFSRNAGQGIALRDLKAVTSRVKQSMANLPTVHVLSSPEQLDRADASQASLYDFIEQAGAMNDVEGATHDGEIYLFASGLADEARAEHVLATHEVTHYGLRAVFGTDLDTVLQSIWANNASVRKQATALRKRLGLKSNVAAVEEVLADMQPADLVKLKGWRKLVGVVRDWLQDRGFTALAGKLDGMLKSGVTEQKQADMLVADVVNAARDWVKGGKRDGKVGSGTALQRVFHGTPNMWAPEPGFPHGRPRLDKIGTGEGAQAFGWGWYSAESQGVAKYYLMEQFGPMPPTGLLAAAVSIRHKYKDDAKKVAFMKQMWPEYSDKEIADAIAQSKELQPVNESSLYQLDIPDSTLPYLLDWDKPLSQQTHEVKKALAGVGITEGKSGEDIYWKVKRTRYSVQESMPASLVSVDAQKYASEYLASIGIVGNRYLDGQSRNRPLKDIKREFLAELPEDADFDEVSELIGTGRFSPKNDALLKALRDDEWLGFDYPAQAISAALSKDLGNYDASPALLRAVADAQEGATFNFVIWDQPTLDKIALLERNGEKLDAMREAETRMSRTGDGQVKDSTHARAIADMIYELATSAGIDVAFEDSKAWGSQYLSLSDKSESRVLRVRIADHQQRYGGNDVYIDPSPFGYGVDEGISAIRAVFPEMPTRVKTGRGKAFLKERSETKQKAEMFMLKNAPKNGIQPSNVYPLVNKIDESNSRAELEDAYQRVIAASTNPDIRFIRNRPLKDIKREFLDELPEDADFMSRTGDTITVDGKQRSRLNSNGKPIAETDEWLMNFWRWFGDSKVVDAHGRPLVVYHGTASEFNKFNSEFIGQTYGQDESGFFFTTDKDEADYVAYDALDDDAGRSKKIIMEVYLKADDPLDKSHKDYSWNSWERAEAANIIDGHKDQLFMEAEIEGNDSIIATGINGHKNIVVFDPAQIKSATGNQGTFDATNPDIRFSRNLRNLNPLQRAKAKYRQLTSQEAIDKVLYEVQDKYIDLRRLRDHIKKIGGVITDLNDAYLGEELYHKRLAKQTEDFLDNELKPLLAGLREHSISMEDFERFLHARHAPEANAKLADSNPNQQEIDAGQQQARATVKAIELQLQTANSNGTATRAIEQSLKQAREKLAQWNGAQAFRGTEAERLSLSGMSDQESAALMAAIPANKRVNYDRLAGMVDTINARTLDTLQRSGLMSKADIDTWRTAYQFYVPLYRDDAHPSDTSHPIGQGFSTRGDAARRRVGSNEQVTNILSHIAMQRESALTRAEKNMVMQKLYLMAKQNPLPDYWKPDAVPMVKVQGKDGFVHTVPDPRYKDSPNILMLRVGGKDVAIEFNKHNPQAFRLAKAMKNLDVDDLHYVIPLIGKGTRWMASVNTQYNPIFGVINFIRDVQGAALNLTTTELAGSERALMKDTIQIMSEVLKNYGRMPKTGRWGVEFDELQSVGGTTGYRDLYLRPEDRANKLKDELKALDRGNVKKAAYAVADWLSDYNEAMENAVRLAAYVAAKDKGMTNVRAASLAKNLTVNFNRKGRQTREIGALFAFFNAALQGTKRMHETLSGPAGKKIMAGGVLIGVLNTVIGMAMMGADGDDDDDNWEKIPEFIKERAIIIPISKDDYITIPMPLGFHFLPNIGRLATEFAIGGNDKTATKQAVSLAVVLADAFNPLGGSAPILQMAMPTVFDPVVALAQNKDWTGKQIYMENYSDLDPDPGYKLTKSTATPWSKAFTELINDVTGGTEYTPGMLSPTPDQIDYIIGQLTGGFGREIGKVAQTVESQFTGDELPPYKIPLVGRLYGNTRGTSGQATAFYENLKKANMIENEIKGRMKDGVGIDEYLAENPNAMTVASAGNRYESRVRKLRARRQDLAKRNAPRDELKAIDDMITATMKEFNREMSGN